MESNEIRLELFRIKKTLNMSQIARSLDPPVTTTAVIRVVNREFVSIRIMEAISVAIGMDKKYVFPEYFLERKKNKP